MQRIVCQTAKEGPVGLLFPRFLCGSMKYVSGACTPVHVRWRTHACTQIYKNQTLIINKTRHILNRKKSLHHVDTSQSSSRNKRHGQRYQTIISSRHRWSNSWGNGRNRINKRTNGALSLEPYDHGEREMSGLNAFLSSQDIRWGKATSQYTQLWSCTSSVITNVIS